MRKLHRALLIAAIALVAGVPVALAVAATPPPPTVVTVPATNVSASGATVNGSVNPNGQQTSYAFQWGPTAGYGHETPLTSAGAGTTGSTVSAVLSGLSPGSTYHFRIIAISSAGTSVGADQSFSTAGTAPAPSAPPSATTGSATAIGSSGATLNGTTNPAGQATTYYFEYGPTANYGFETSAQGGGSGTTGEPVNANVTGLSLNTTYHYRLVAVNLGGTALGADKTFTTTKGSSHVAFMGRMGFVSPGRVIGIEAGCFGGWTRCAGHVTISHNGIVIGQRDFNIAPNSGGFQNIELSYQGAAMLRRNRVFHLLPVAVSVTTTDGQRISETMHLGRWVWH